MKRDEVCPSMYEVLVEIFDLGASNMPPFEVTAKNIARVLGIPDYPFVMVEHPIGSRSFPEIKGLAKIAYHQALAILYE